MEGIMKAFQKQTIVFGEDEENTKHIISSIDRNKYK